MGKNCRPDPFWGDIGSLFSLLLHGSPLKLEGKILHASGHFGTLSGEISWPQTPFGEIWGSNFFLCPFSIKTQSSNPYFLHFCPPIGLPCKLWKFEEKTSDQKGKNTCLWGAQGLTRSLFDAPSQASTKGIATDLAVYVVIFFFPVL